MSRYILSSLACGLTLLAVPVAFAQNDTSGKRSSQTHDQQGEIRTIRGEVAGVNVVGESMVDFDTGRAVTARATYLTILGAPSEKASANQEPGKSSDQARHNAEGKSGARRMVYFIAVTPDTTIQAQTSPRDAGDRSSQDKENAKGPLDQLQLGDRVKVEFIPHMGHSGQDQKNQSAAGNKQGQGGDKTSQHGRNRIVRGEAKSITILASTGENANSGEGQSAPGKSHRSGSSIK